MLERGTIYELLLLDDDEDDYMLLRTMLDDCYGDAVKLDWYQKDGVANQMICSGIYRVTFVDYRLGSENGLDVIRKVKAQCPDQIIFLFTAWRQETSADLARKAGANGLLDKMGLSIQTLKTLLSPYLPEIQDPASRAGEEK